MDLPSEISTKSAQETQNFGKKIGSLLVMKGSVLPHVLCLYGDLGSGKTTLAQGIAKGLGIKSRILSPTFIIVRRYDFLYHFDLYRLENTSDVSSLGFAEVLADPKSILILEWAEKLGELLPKKRMDIHCSVEENGVHRIKIWMKQ